VSFTTSPPDCFLLFQGGVSDNCNITSNIQQFLSIQIFPQFDKLFTRRWTWLCDVDHSEFFQSVCLWCRLTVFHRWTTWTSNIEVT